MESRIFFLFLKVAFASAALLMAGCSTLGTDPSGDDTVAPVIDPQVERREIIVPKIDRENIEIGAFIGQMSIEDFGVNTLTGVQLAFHVTEDFFVEGVYATTQADKTSYELLSGAVQLLPDDAREFTYYNVSLGYNLFPGEVFVSSRWAFNSALYLIGGVGSTKFAGADQFTMNFGVGTRLFATDWLALHADVRDHIFDSDLLGEARTSHNFEYHVGFTIFF